MLRSTLAAARARLAAEGDAALRDAGLPSRLAFLLQPVLEALATNDVGDASDLLLELVGKERRRPLLAALADPAASLRALDANPPLRDACQALLRALDGEEASATPAVSQRMEAEHIENSRMYTSGGDLTVHEAPPDSEEGRRQRDLRTYLARTASECNALSLAQLDSADADDRALTLASVYIRLHVNEPLEDDEHGPSSAPLLRLRQQRGERDKRTAVQAFAAAPDGRLLLLGRPGSGKSTFLNHLAFCLAEGYAAQLRGDKAAAAQWAEQLEGWARGPLLPVRIILRDFARFAPLAAATRGDTALLFDFLEETFRRASYGAALEPIKHALEAESAVLLLDGLDEVVDKPTLRKVVQCIGALLNSYRACPMLVTCRILDYQDEPLRHLATFAVRTLDDLTTEQAEQFVRDWYRTLAASGRRTQQQADDDTHALLDAIAAREELRDLATLPLLLTLMALVHVYKGLPDALAQLYADCVNLLLIWRQPRGEPAVVASLELSEFRQSNLLALLAQLAYQAQIGAPPTVGVNAPPSDLSGPEVRSLFAAGLERFDKAHKDELAARLLAGLARGNGLLMQRGPDVYTFPHRTFQEFLAGYYLLSRADYYRQCKALAAQTRWHEALLLMVGYESSNGNAPERPLRLAGELLDCGPAEQVLAGEMLNLIGRAKAAEYDPHLLEPGNIWHRARGKLLTLLTQGTAPVTLRNRAGLAVGRLCYGSTAVLAQGTAPPLPDPRLPLVFVGTNATHTEPWRRAFGTYWCHVDAGKFWFGDDKEGNLRQVELPYTFQIARYPVTNADFARFVAVGGYREQRWWTPNGWQWLQSQNQTQPMLFDTLRYNNPIQPVVGVTWYEAAAYCRWLDAHMRAANLLDERTEIRLPTSLEWERAARHTDKRRYPWGDEEPDAERANYDITGIGLPSPVGCFPRGRAKSGAFDMGGNVFEWVATAHGSVAVVGVAKDLTLRERVDLPGGAYAAPVEYLCCGSRNWFYPNNWINYLGFRLVRSLRARA